MTDPVPSSLIPQGEGDEAPQITSTTVNQGNKENIVQGSTTTVTRTVIRTSVLSEEQMS